MILKLWNLLRFRSAGVSVDSLVDYMSLLPKGDETREKRLGILEEEKKN